MSLSFKHTQKLVLFSLNKSLFNINMFITSSSPLFDVLCAKNAFLVFCEVKKTPSTAGPENIFFSTLCMKNRSH